MLEWITSKVVVSIAALLMLVSVGGFFTIQQDGMKGSELKNVSDNLAKAINQVSTLNSEATLVISFDNEGKGAHLPSSINGERYSVEMQRDLILCKMGGKEAATELLTNVHLFDPTGIDLTNKTMLRQKDILHQSIKISSIGEILVLRERTGSQDAQAFETFIIYEG
jgi:hypothetical protein